MLGLAGAIYKAKWLTSGQSDDLERAFEYYFRGYSEGIMEDFGYTAINAAYVLDLLAYQSRRFHSQIVTCSELQTRATRIREEIVNTLPRVLNAQPSMDGQWWFLVTIAEAYFGLGRHDDAREWLRKAQLLDPDEWELESTARQFVSLLHRQGDQARLSDRSAAWRVIEELLGQRANSLSTADRGNCR